MVPPDITASRQTAASKPARAGEAEFRALYKELVEINTTLSVGSCTDAANAMFSSSFVAASNSRGNYVKFTIAGTAFTTSAAPVSGDNATLRAPVNGIQIVGR